MTEAQRKAVGLWLMEHETGIRQLHHGACMGADVDFHNVCIDMEMIQLIHVHPSDDRFTNRLRQLKQIERVAMIWPEEAPLQRDLTMVQYSDVLLATPLQDDEIVRSGTWATVRRARKLRKTVHVFRRDGTLDK
jgi:hypothetical protein